MRILNKLFSEEKGVTSIEYALIAALVAIAIVGAVTLVGEELTGFFEYVSVELEKALSVN